MISRIPAIPFIASLALLMCQLSPAFSAPLTDEKAAAFLTALVDQPDSQNIFLDEDDLAFSRRLGISYPEAPCKPLISWDLPPHHRDRLLQEGTGGQFVIEKLDASHSRLVLFPTDSTLTRNWIFRDGKLVSSILYQTREWKRIESPHFRFVISDPAMFHQANIEVLEAFVADMAALLGFSNAEMDRLAREKITYCFCRDQEEIRALTGFAARGMYMVSHDIVVSTYSSHFHELAHLLMNYKLQRPHLYTHPLFLEGFAVAVGGRGGKAPDILHQLGLSIHRQGWLSLDELLDPAQFQLVNASVSYPASAVFIRFLMETLMMEDFLELYARHGGDAQTMMSMKVNPGDLPDEAAWRQYLGDQPSTGAITPGAPGLDSSNGSVAFQRLAGGTHFGFAVADTLLVFDGSPASDYHSFLYKEFFPNEPYAGQRYFIRASSEEAAVYDLFTNTMLALYATGFTEDMVEIPSHEDRFLFRVDRSVFPGKAVKE